MYKSSPHHDIHYAHNITLHHSDNAYPKADIRHYTYAYMKTLHYVAVHTCIQTLKLIPLHYINYLTYTTKHNIAFDCISETDILKHTYIHAHIHANTRYIQYTH